MRSALYAKETNETTFTILKVDFNNKTLTIKFNGQKAMLRDVSIDDYGYIYDMSGNVNMKSRQWYLLVQCYLNLFNLEFDKRWYNGEIEVGHTVTRK